MSHSNDTHDLNASIDDFLQGHGDAEYLIDYAANARSQFASTVSQIAIAMLHRAIRSGDVRPLNAFLQRFASQKGSRIDVVTIFRAFLATIDNIREVMQYRKGEYSIIPGTSLIRDVFDLPPLTTDIFTVAKRDTDALKKPKSEAKLAREAANHLRNAMKCCEALKIQDVNAIEILRMRLRQIVLNSPKED